MSVERELTISILKLTKNALVEHELLNRDAKIPSSTARNLLRKMQNEGFIYLQGGAVKTEALQRLRLAVHAIELGADTERVAGFLEWTEFEQMAAAIFDMNGYKVTKNLRFKEGSKRWEIDVVACKKPIMLCMDCKHWHRTIFPSALEEIVEKQTERTKSLARSLPNPAIRVECTTWEKGTMIPGVLSLLTGSSRICNDVPIVSVLQLQDFLTQLPAFTSKFRNYEIKASHIM